MPRRIRQYGSGFGDGLLIEPASPPPASNKHNWSEADVIEGLILQPKSIGRIEAGYGRGYA
jgi:hypothetical protein